MTSRKDLLEDAARRGAKYLEAAEHRSVAPKPGAVAGLAHLGGPLPQLASDPAEVLALLDEFGSPATVVNACGRFFGFVVGGAVPASLAASVLASVWDQNAAMRASSPVSAALEDIALEWLRDLLNLPADCGGGFVTGATMANFTCIAAARHALLARVGWNVEADGLFGAPPITVVAGAEVHASIRKALAMAGLGMNRVLSVPVDEQGRMRPEAMPKLDTPAIICVQAGNVNTGAFDPAEEICAIARESGSWVHVDGAFGFWAAAAPHRAHLMRGYNLADSWATDAHKWLNVPYDCGLAFVRDAGAMRAAMSVDAAYLKTGAAREPMHWTPELSRRSRGVEVWAALRSLGREGLAEMIERNCRQATRFADGVSAAGHRVLNDVVINQVLVSFGSDEATAAVIRSVQEDGTCWCAGTVWQGRAAMRISVSSWATTDADVEASLAAILQAAKDTP